MNPKYELYDPKDPDEPANRVFWMPNCDFALETNCCQQEVFYVEGPWYPGEAGLPTPTNEAGQPQEGVWWYYGELHWFFERLSELMGAFTGTLPMPRAHQDFGDDGCFAECVNMHCPKRHTTHTYCECNR